MGVRRRIGCGVGLVCLSAAPAMAGPYAGLVVFGDSLSDAGNVQAASGSLVPGPYYYQGRFSNGPTYVDRLAAGLGLPAPVASLAGGTDYAYGDARTTGTPFPTSLIVQDVDKQIASYLGNHTPTASTLYDVYVGGNDLFAQIGTTNPTPAVPAQAVANDVAALYARGARQFLVPNLPLLGNTPTYNTNAATMASANAITMQFNAALAADLAVVQSADAGIVIHTLDVQSLFSQLQMTPGTYGFTNVTSPAAPGLAPGATAYDASLEAPNPNQYLFWDTVHPTAAGHALLGTAALQAVGVPEPAAVCLAATAGLFAVARRRRA